MMAVGVFLVLHALGARTAQCPAIERGYNYAGHDLTINGTTSGVADVVTLEKCCAICVSLADAKPQGCSVFTYRASLKTCHPKYSSNGRKPSAGATSGSGTTPPPYTGDQPNIVFLIDESTGQTCSLATL